MANRVVELLSRIYKTAEDRELIPEGSNPCQEIGKYRQRRHERFLTDEEFRRLGRLLDEAEGSDDVPVHAVMAIRLLLLTGCRKNEILNLRWDHVDLETKEMRLAEAKTGPRTVQLSPAAAAVLARVPRDRWQSACVIAGRRKGMRLVQSPSATGTRSASVRGSRTCAFTTAAIRSPRGRWRWARACR